MNEVAEENLVYLYCVTKKVPILKEAENLIDKLCFVYHCGLYAVVSKVSRNDFNKENLEKNVADLEWLDAKVRIHEGVIERIMRNRCAVPFRFATLFNSNNSLKLFLEDHAPVLREKLKSLEGKEEWGIKIYCDIERLKGTVIKEEDEILRIANEINSSAPGKIYFLKKKKEELINGTITKRINEFGQKSFKILKELSLEARINRLLPKEVTEREDDMVLNSAFLVEKSKIVDFLNAADSLKAEYHDRGLNFNCTGPWPPYNFCNFSKENWQNG